MALRQRIISVKKKAQSVNPLNLNEHAPTNADSDTVASQDVDLTTHTKTPSKRKCQKVRTNTED
jgi:hypothetical protein